MLQTNEETKSAESTSTGSTGTTAGTTETGTTSTSGTETSTDRGPSTSPNTTTAGTTETGGTTDGRGASTVPPITDNRPRLVRIDEMPEPPAPKKRGPKGPWKNKKIESTGTELLPDPDELPEITPPSKFEKLNAKDLNLMICGTFDMLAVVLGKHWSISEADGEKISKPAARILSRMAISKTINKYSDYTVLLMAVIGIVGPRLLFTLSLKTENKEVRAHVQRVNSGDPKQQQPSNGEKSETVSNPRPAPQQTAYTIPNDIHDVLPAVMP